MFWKHFTPPVSELDNLLAKEDCSLTELLDAEDVLQECKGINNKLLKFLTRQENIEELVSLVTSEPLDDVDEAERFKYPNTACNILTSGAGALVDKLIAEEALLDKLFEFMDSEPPLNSLLASFFSRVVVELFSKKASHMLEYISSKEGLVDKFLAHIDTSAIMDLVLGIVSSFQMSDERRELCTWMEQHAVVTKLVDLISGGVDGEKQRNAARTLTELHRHGYEYLSMNYDNVTQDELVEALESSELVDRLLHNALVGDGDVPAPSAAPLCHAPEYLHSMVTLQQVGTQTNGLMADSIQYPNVTNEDAARRVAERVVPFVPQLIAVLRSPPPRAEPSSVATTTADGGVTAAATVVPLGPARLSVIRLLTTLTQVGCAEFDGELARVGLAAVLLDLFAEFQWNSFLHAHVDQFVAFTLGSSSDATRELLRSLIVDARLLQRLAEVAMENEADAIATSSGDYANNSDTDLADESGVASGDSDDEATPRPPAVVHRRSRRRGYMGHVVNMSNAILQGLDGNDELRAAIEDTPTDDLDEWRQWVDGPLETVNKKNNSVLGGSIPIMSLEDSDEDIPIDTPHQQSQQQPQIADAFSFYQSQQMASDFADSFGFDDEDFSGDFEDSENAQFEHGASVDFTVSAEEDANSSSLFEQACSERLQRYSDDEEDDEGSDGEQSGSRMFSNGGGGRDEWLEREPEVQRDMSFGNDTVDSDSSSSSDSTSNSRTPPQDMMEPGSSGDDDDDDDEEEEEGVSSQAPFVIRQNVPLSRLNPDSHNNDNEAEAEVNDLFMDIAQNRQWTANFDSLGMDTTPLAGEPAWDDECGNGSGSAVSNNNGAVAATSGETSETVDWASFAEERGVAATTTTDDQAPLVSSSSPPTEAATSAEGTPSAATGDEQMAERNSGSGGNSSGGDVSSTDSSDDSDERDGSYSFSHMSSGSDNDSSATNGGVAASDDRGGEAPTSGVTVVVDDPDAGSEARSSTAAVQDTDVSPECAEVEMDTSPALPQAQSGAD